MVTKKMKIMARMTDASNFYRETVLEFKEQAASRTTSLKLNVRNQAKTRLRCKQSVKPSRLRCAKESGVTNEAPKTRATKKKL